MTTTSSSSTSARWTTAAALFTVASVLLYLDHSSTVAAAKRVRYAQWHPYIEHRLSEGAVAVLSFAAAGFFFSLCEHVTSRKLRTTVIGQADHSLCIEVGSVESSTATFLPSTDATTFAFWLIVNIVVYLGVIDVSQRVLGDSLATLHYADAEPCSFLRIAVEVAFSVWAYDFAFWWIHRSWHSGGVSGWWKRLHLLHHDHYRAVGEPISVMNTFHHHLLDATAQVAINILVQQIPLSFFFPGPRHKLSKLVHNVVVTWLLVEAHSGLDLPFMTHRVLPSLMGGAVRHQIHHQLGRVYYHQFFTYLDDWLGPPARIVLAHDPRARGVILHERGSGAAAVDCNVGRRRRR